MSAVKIAIAGASGYGGEELLRLLSGHEGVEIVAVTSRSAAGSALGEMYPRFLGTRYGGLKFSASTAEAMVAAGAEIAVLALPHGLAHEFAVPLLAAGLRVIDRSADFRIRDAAVFEEFYGGKHQAPELLAESVYGLPEIYRDEIKAARLVASPGCYPTSMLLPLIPLLRAGAVSAEGIAVSSMSGVSGAGRKAEVAYSFCETTGSLRPYGVPKHRHLAEVEQELSLAAGSGVRISFTPHLVPVSRGILTTIYAPLAGKAEAVGAALEAAYAREPFVRLLSGSQFPDTKNVVGTNFIDIAWRPDPRTGRVVLMSAEDNLVKGAAGQAIQSLNLMAGCRETDGLL